MGGAALGSGRALRQRLQVGDGRAWEGEEGEGRRRKDGPSWSGGLPTGGQEPGITKTFPRITPHHTPSRPITPQYIAPHPITPHYTPSSPITPHHTPPHPIIIPYELTQTLKLKPTIQYSSIGNNHYASSCLEEYQSVLNGVGVIS